MDSTASQAGRSNARDTPSLLGVRVDRALAWTIFGLTFLAGMYRNRFGIGYADEGLYLTAPMRFSLGDTPFRDEFITVLRMFDVVLWPLFELFPSISVYELRTLWLCVQLGCTFALYRVLARFAPRWVAAMGCASGFFVPNLIATPGYHVMGVYLLSGSWALWYESLLIRNTAARVGLGVAGGVVFALAVISLLPNAVLAVFPIGILVAGLVGENALRDYRVPTGAFVVSFASVLAAFILGIVLAGLADDWLAANASAGSSSNYTWSLVERVRAYVNESFDYAAPFVVPLILCGFGAMLIRASASAVILSKEALGRVIVGALLFVVVAVAVAFALDVQVDRWVRDFGLFSTARGGALSLGVIACAVGGIALFRFPKDSPVRAVLTGVSIAGAFMAGLAVCLFPDAPPVETLAHKDVLYHRPMRLFCAALALHGAAAASLFAMGERAREWRLVYLLSLAGGLYLGLFFGFIGSMPWKSMFAMPLVLSPALAGLYRALGGQASLAAGRLRAGIVVATVGIVFAVGMIGARVIYVEEGPTRLRTAAFESEPLAGIYSTPEKVAALDRFVAYMKPRVVRGEFLLVDGPGSVLFYLTGTRPSLDHSFTSETYSREVIEASYRKMQEQEREPRYVVRFPVFRPALRGLKPGDPWPDDPASSFILSHYVLETVIAPFEVWRAKDLAPLGADEETIEL